MTFDEWFEEPEAFATRGERIMDMPCIDALRATWDAAEKPAEQALRAILKIVQDYLPPDGPYTGMEALSAIISVVDPWPLIEPDLLDTSKEAGK